MFTKIYNKAKNLWRQPAADYQETSEGYLPFFDANGFNDDFPLKWAKAIAESPSATSCLSTLTDFLEGFGFSDVDLEKLVVNSKGETFFQIHQQTVESFAPNEGFYWRFIYDGTGTVADWIVLPFENCRLGKPDSSGYISKIFYNPFFGTPYYKGANQKQTVEYDVFNPKAVKDQYLKQRTKYKGQVFYFGTSSAMSRFYPLPKPYASLKWFQSEAGIADYYEDKIDNGFLNEFMLLMRGDPNAQSTNPEFANDKEPTTVAQEFDMVVDKNFMGRGAQNNMMVQWLSIGEEKPETISFPSSASSEMFLTIDNQATKKITVAWNVPGILANIHEGVSLGGDANQIRVAVKLMQQRVIKKQRLLTDAYSKILSKFAKPYVQDITIVPYNPYPELEVVDDKIWNALTAEERRQWIQDNTEIDLAESVVQDPAQPAPQQNKFLNAVPVGFPESVKNGIKKTLDYVDTMAAPCTGKSGRMLSEAIINNQSLPLKQLKRIHSYLKKNEKYANAPYNEGCGSIEYHAWGGKEMFDFLEGKLKDIDTWLN
jgi:YHS domain-containing protein